MAALEATIRTRSRQAGLVGPQGYPLVGHLFDIRRDPLNYFVRVSREFGDVVPIQMGPERVLMINRPEYIKHILVDNQPNYHKSKFYQKIKPILGDGIFISEDETWLKQRRTVQPAFQGHEIAAMVDDMTTAGAEMMERWSDHIDSGRPMNVATEMMRVTLDIVFRALLNLRLGDEAEAVYGALTVVLREAERRVWALTSIGEHLPTARNREFRRALAVLDDIIYRIINRGRQNPSERSSLLSMLVEAYGDTEDPAVARLLRDQVMSIVLAGHETTANALSWSWYLLSRNPAVERRLQDEVDSVLGGRLPTYEDVKKLNYTRMVFDEALRLYPPVWTFSRTAQDDDALGEVEIPKGTTVMLCAYAVHRNPEHWENPEGFDPDRFELEAVKSRTPFCYFPFSGGPRLCVGHRFGAMEGHVLLAMIVQKLSLQLVPGHVVKPEPMITLRPRDGIMVTLSRR